MKTKSEKWKFFVSRNKCVYRSRVSLELELMAVAARQKIEIKFFKSRSKFELNWLAEHVIL